MITWLSRLDSPGKNGNSSGFSMLFFLNVGFSHYILGIIIFFNPRTYLDLRPRMVFLCHDFTITNQKKWINLCHGSPNINSKQVEAHGFENIWDLQHFLVNHHFPYGHCSGIPPFVDTGYKWIHNCCESVDIFDSTSHSNKQTNNPNENRM